MKNDGRGIRFKVKETEFREREIVLRLPFKFGAVTLTAVPQLIACVVIELENGLAGKGSAAETLVPKWFDKNPDLSNEDNYEQLRAAARIAAGLYRESPLQTAFGLYSACYRDQMSRGAGRGLNPLLASFGQAILDRAVLDAICSALGISFFQAVRSNVPGLGSMAIAPELADFDFAGFLAGLKPVERINARHTIGLLDPLASEDLKEKDRINDGLPETLEEVIRFYGNRFFKIKISGDVEADIDRLNRISGILERSAPGFLATLDGNEQYRDPEHFQELWNRAKEDSRLDALLSSIIFVEQPIHRDHSFDRSVDGISTDVPVIIDESDCDLDAFPRAAAFGYRGVSSKQCKGIYKSIINKARCLKWNREEGFEKYLLSGEDLTTQAGLSVQQNLALASILGLSHLELNGHHYVRGMSGLPPEEQAGYLEKYPSLYTREDDYVRLDIREGQLDMSSLDRPDFAS